MNSEREEYLTIMQSCLRTSAEIFSTLEDKREITEEGHAVVLIDESDLTSIWSRTLNQEFPRERVPNLMNTLIHCINQYSHSTCAVWNLAHYIEHEYAELQEEGATRH